MFQSDSFCLHIGDTQKLCFFLEGLIEAIGIEPAFAFQTERATRPTTVSVLEATAQYLRFGSLFESDLLVWPNSPGAVALAAALLCSLALIAYGLLRPNRGEGPQAIALDGPSIPMGFKFA